MLKWSSPTVGKYHQSSGENTATPSSQKTRLGDFCLATKPFYSFQCVLRGGPVEVEVWFQESTLSCIRMDEWYLQLSKSILEVLGNLISHDQKKAKQKYTRKPVSKAKRVQGGRNFSTTSKSILLSKNVRKKKQKRSLKHDSSHSNNTFPTLHGKESLYETRQT